MLQQFLPHDPVRAATHVLVKRDLTLCASFRAIHTRTCSDRSLALALAMHWALLLALSDDALSG